MSCEVGREAFHFCSPFERLSCPFPWGIVVLMSLLLMMDLAVM